MVRKKYHIVIHFSIISNFYVSLYPAYYYLDIFKLGYILSHSIGQELVYIDPFLTNEPILFPLKTPENQKSSNVFRRYKMGTMVRDGLIKFIIPRWGPAKKISFLLAYIASVGEEVKLKKTRLQNQLKTCFNHSHKKRKDSLETRAACS